MLKYLSEKLKANLKKLKFSKLFFLNTKKKILIYLSIGVILLLFDTCSTLILDIVNLNISIFNWAFYFFYFIISLFVSRALPSRFYNFIETNNDLFDNSNEYLKQSKLNFESKIAQAIYIVFSIGFIMAFIFIKPNENQLYSFIIIRSGNLIFLVTDILVSLITLIFFSSIVDLVWTLFSLVRLIGTKKCPININVGTIRQGNLKIIGKWFIYGMSIIVIFQIPSITNYISTFLKIGNFMMYILNISSILFIVLFLFFLNNIKHIHSQIKNFKQQQIKTWLSQIQDEFSNQDPNYLKISTLEISISKLKNTPNWPIGFNFQSLIIFVIPLVSFIIYLSQFIIQL